VSQITLLPAAARTVQSWKNGGGKTTEIATGPAGAGIDAFDWRISTATVSTAGGFSHFDHVDRTLAVIEGRLRLAFEARTVELDSATPTFAFEGDIACFGTPLDGAAIDLNLMVRRERYRGSIDRLEATQMTSALLKSLHTFVIFVEGGSLRWRSEMLALQHWDAVRIDGAIGEPIATESNGAVYVLSIAPL
jgi:environmental stress-induced protein Ves